MALPFQFSTNTNPTGTQLDADLIAAALLGTTPCAATGTNAISLTPVPNSAPDVTAYQNLTKFGFVAPATTTGLVTASVSGLPFVPVYLPSLAQAGANAFSSGAPVIITYVVTLGGFVVTSALPNTAVTPVSEGGASRLKVTNNAVTPNTKVTITAARAVLINGSGSPVFSNAPSVTIDLTTTGANGMDTGGRPTSGWVYLYLISTGSVTAGLATVTSPISGNPTMPGGYSYLLFVGAMRCDGSRNLLRTLQLGRSVQYVVTPATNTAALPTVGSGAAGNVTTPTWAALSITALVPATATVIDLVLSCSAGSGSVVAAAPNGNYGAVNSATNAPPLTFLNTEAYTTAGYFALESTNVYWASSNAGGLLQCLGWEDSSVAA